MAADNVTLDAITARRIASDRTDGDVVAANQKYLLSIMTGVVSTLQVCGTDAADQDR
jgi:hypothetical protein